MKKIFKNILITSLFFSIVSCSNLLEQSKDNTQGDNKNVDNTTTIMIGSTKIKKQMEHVQLAQISQIMQTFQILQILCWQEKNLETQIQK